METNNRNIPLNQLPGFEATNRLTAILQEAYFRRSRQLPANLADIVATFKGDLLKRMPSVTIGTIDEAITDHVLNKTEIPLSPSFFFAAVKARYVEPRTPRDCDIDPTRRPDFEADTISLLDTIAEAVKEGKKPYCNWHREYQYLILRGQIAWDAYEAELGAAREHINTERVRNFKRPIADFVGGFKNDLCNEARRLAVLRWIARCNEQECRPSDILTPLINEQEYQQFRKTI